MSGRPRPRWRPPFPAPAGLGRSREGGFSSPVLISLFALMVLFIGGLSVDLWRVIADHREVAGLVDGAAIAGATAVDVDALRDFPDDPPVLDGPLAVGRACAYLQANAGVAACPAADVEVVVVGEAIFVSFRRDVDLTLLRLVDITGGGDDSPIEVYAESDATLQRGLP